MARLFITPYGAVRDYQEAETLADKALALASLIPGEKLVTRAGQAAQSALKYAANLYKQGKFTEAGSAVKQALSHLNPAPMQMATPNGAPTKAAKTHNATPTASHTRGEKGQQVKAACSPYPACFVAGTLIQTEDGLKPIEQIQRGDLVWSRQEFGDAYAYKPVFETKCTKNQQLYEVVVENQQGETETYLTTSEHPFYINGLGWLKASLLEAGMPLLDRDGNAGSLKVRSQTRLECWDTVYNLEVEDYVTYHIGEFGVWVHNTCCDLEPITYNGRVSSPIGTGGNKIVYDIGNNKVLAVMKPGKKTEELQHELNKLQELKSQGLPVVNAKLIQHDGKPALLMDKYAQGSKNIVKIDHVKGKAVVVNNADTSLLNQNSINDLIRIKDTMVKQKIRIDDLQFLIGKNGQVVISDPLKVTTGAAPSNKNIRMIELLIQEARKNIK